MRALGRIVLARIMGDKNRQQEQDHAAQGEQRLTEAERKELSGV
jgi:hypothetical protein